MSLRELELESDFKTCKDRIKMVRDILNLIEMDVWPMKDVCLKGRAKEHVRAAIEVIDGKREQFRTSYYPFEYPLKEEK